MVTYDMTLRRDSIGAAYDDYANDAWPMVLLLLGPNVYVIKGDVEMTIDTY
jgi:hypothetical protein